MPQHPVTCNSEKKKNWQKQLGRASGRGITDAAVTREPRRSKTKGYTHSFWRRTPFLSSSLDQRCVPAWSRERTAETQCPSAVPGLLSLGCHSETQKFKPSIRHKKHPSSLPSTARQKDTQTQYKTLTESKEQHTPPDDSHPTPDRVRGVVGASGGIKHPWPPFGELRAQSRGKGDTAASPQTYTHHKNPPTCVHMLAHPHDIYPPPPPPILQSLSHSAASSRQKRGRQSWCMPTACSWTKGLPGASAAHDELNQDTHRHGQHWEVGHTVQSCKKGHHHQFSPLSPCHHHQFSPLSPCHRHQFSPFSPCHHHQFSPPSLVTIISLTPSLLVTVISLAPSLLVTVISLASSLLVTVISLAPSLLVTIISLAPFPLSLSKVSSVSPFPWSSSSV